MSQGSEAASQRTKVIEMISILAGILGLLLVVSPFVFTSTDTAVWNHVIVGSVIFVLAAYNYSQVRQEASSMMSAIGLLVLLAAWTIVSPFAFEVGSDGLLWSTVIIGVLTLIFAGSIATSERRLRSTAPEIIE